jgi:hypothetical protein
MGIKFFVMTFLVGRDLKEVYYEVVVILSTISTPNKI